MNNPNLKEKTDGINEYSHSEGRASASEIYLNNDNNNEPTNPFSKFIDGFKRVDLDDEEFDTSNMTDLEKSIYATAKHPLTRRLKARHIQMIALGGAIGTGLFIGNGYALSFGPGNLLLGYTVVGLAIYLVMNALGELSCQFPVSGAFTAYFSRFIDPSWGFVLGILYACSWLVSFPSELIACAMTIQYWNTSVSPAVWVAVFYVIIVSINMFGVKGYGEAEFTLSFIKVIAIVGFIILGVCIICGVGDEGYIGGKYWNNPGSFNMGFKGFCQSIISSAFGLGGIELVCLSAAETENTRKALPRAIKQVFWRIFIFYFLSSVIIGCLVPFTDPRLLSGNNDEDISASPFVIAINNAGIKVLPDIMNVVILIAVVSVGTASIYGCSRTIASLAAQKLIPEIFGYIDKRGRPLMAILITNTFGLLGFLVINENESTIFTWLFSVCSLSSFFTWFAICLTHVRFRMAMNKRLRSTEELIFPAPTGIIGSYIGMAILLFLIACELYISISPTDGSPNAEAFFQYCLSLPLIFVMWIVHKTYYRTWNSLYVKLDDMDLDVGRREVDLEFLKQDLAEERQYISSKPFYYRIYRFLC